ncbi:MAG: DMT family transporter [Planctomycetes bacterium]|nr:DMT family transporter [Planctomycetota bacterium]
METPHRRRFWTGMLVGVTAVWGWTFLVVKEATGQYGVVGFLAARFALATAIMGPFLATRRSVGLARDSALVGGVLAASYLFQTFGLAATSATHCGLITGLFVVFVPIANRVLFRRPVPGTMWIAACLSVTGLFLLTGAGMERPRFGDLLTLGAAVCLGLHCALLEQVARRHDAAAFAGGQFLVATIVFLAVWPLVDRVRPPPRDVIPAIVLTGVLATAVGFLVQTVVQQKLAAARVAVILTLETVFAAFFGVVLGGDRLGPTQWIGAAVMLVAVTLAEIVPRMRGESAQAG